MVVKKLLVSSFPCKLANGVMLKMHKSDSEYQQLASEHARQLQNQSYLDALKAKQKKNVKFQDHHYHMPNVFDGEAREYNTEFEFANKQELLEFGPELFEGWRVPAEEIKENAECAICVDKLDHPSTVRLCKTKEHQFHDKCLYDQLKSGNDRCALCNVQMPIPQNFLKNPIATDSNINVGTTPAPLDNDAIDSNINVGTTPAPSDNDSIDSNINVGTTPASCDTDDDAPDDVADDVAPAQTPGSGGIMKYHEVFANGGGKGWMLFIILGIILLSVLVAIMVRKILQKCANTQTVGENAETESVRPIPQQNNGVVVPQQPLVNNDTPPPPLVNNNTPQPPLVRQPVVSAQKPLPPWQRPRLAATWSQIPQYPPPQWGIAMTP